MGKTSEIIGIAADHGGYEMKEFIKQKLIEFGFEVKDFGTTSEASVDYPDYIHPLAKEIDQKELNKGLIFCGSGNGAQMTANKYANVRAALCWDLEQTILTRQHNNANVLSLPGRFVPFEDAWKMVQIFLETPFEGGRHSLRVNKISQTK